MKYRRAVENKNKERDDLRVSTLGYKLIQFNSILFMFHNIHNRPSLTGKVNSQIKSCASHRAVIKYKQISMILDTHYIYTLQEDIYK
jgi:hypothetical protein